MKAKTKNKSILIAAGVCALSVIVMIVVLCSGSTSQTQTAAFVPPAFDAAAVAGTPTTADSSWSQIYQDGMDFSAHVCGLVVIEDGAADVYFTNDEGNTVWMKLRIMDEDGNILAETGLLKPGEYVQSIAFDIIPQNGSAIKMKIMTYEPDTYYSAGAVTLNTTVTVVE